MTTTGTTATMIVGRLCLSFDRGRKSNRAADLGLESKPTTTEDGGKVVGLGTHYRSEEAHTRAKRLAKEESRVREEFRKAFLASPIPGIYVIPERGDGRKLLETLSIDPDVAAHVAEYELGFPDALPPVEIREWASRVKRQITDVPLGKTKWAEEGQEGVVTLEKLAECPLLDDSTSAALLSLIADAKLKAITRVELKRMVADLDVKVTTLAKPRRVKAQKVEPTGKPVQPRRAKAKGKDGEAAA